MAEGSKIESLRESARSSGYECRSTIWIPEHLAREYGVANGYYEIWSDGANVRLLRMED